MKSIRATETTSARWTVGALMTAQPFTIGRRESLETAHRLMREQRIRHLPVLERGELIGIVTQRDLYFLETIRGVDLEEDIVEDAMTTDTYAVAPDTPIGAVAKNMARHRYGCAVVLERGKVAGIFTVTDALRLVSALAPDTLMEDAMNGSNEAEHPKGTPRTTPHRSFLDDDVADGREHGERMDGVPREDELAGTSGSHARLRDKRQEEPFGEIAPSADTEGGID